MLASIVAFSSSLFCCSTDLTISFADSRAKSSTADESFSFRVSSASFSFLSYSSWAFSLSWSVSAFLTFLSKSAFASFLRMLCSPVILLMRLSPLFTSFLCSLLRFEGLSSDPYFSVALLINGSIAFSLKAFLISLYGSLLRECSSLRILSTSSSSFVVISP